GGHPAAGSVKLFRLAATANPDSAVLRPPVWIGTFAAQADGKYRFDSLPPAVYALEATDTGSRNYSLAPRLALETAKDTLVRTLTLKPPGRITGLVTRGPNPLPGGVDGNAGILVRLGGADRFAITGPTGNFVLENVPEGAYRIAFAAADGHYEPAFTDTLGVASGVTLPLPVMELAWSRFQDPPAPAGLAVAVDSAAGLVRLSWRAVKLANFDHYEVARVDSLDSADNAVFSTRDTTFTDTVTDLPPGRGLVYRIVAVNALGNRSPNGGAQERLAVVPPRPVAGAGTGYLAGVVLYKSAPVSGFKARLYKIPAAPGSPDSLPLPTVLIDSAVTGGDGRYRFDGLPMDTLPNTRHRYTVIAGQGTGAAETAALKNGLAARADSAVLDSLTPLQTGSIEGRASRDSLWVSSPFKGDENIPVSVAGAPYTALTSYSGTPGAGAPFSLTGIPPGRHKVVVYAVPIGYFLPDTVEVTVSSGAVTNLDATLKARYNPAAPPPKIATLAISSASRTTVRLAWNPVTRYAPLKGYRVVRLGADLTESARSAVVTTTTWTDDVSALPSGSEWFYVVRVVNQADREGGNGGAASGLPVAFRVPVTAP
ncbi:MAG: hypothetical protein ABIW76_16550, partial [Fibrobacteria bacterium]